MQCPACHVEAVSGAAFCNNCGAALPLVCHQCTAANPPLSRFCIRCGTAIQAAADIPDPPEPRQHEPTLRDVATDTRVLAVDIARYSAPRIKTATIATARTTRRFASYTALRFKTAATAITQRARRSEEPPSQAPVVEDNPLPVPTPVPPPTAPKPPPSQEPQAADTPSPNQPATTCPRCRAVNQAGSIFCFNCGLPLDETAPAARPRQYHAGHPAGFGVRLAAALVDVAIVTVVQLCLIAVWPGLPEYFDSDAQLHWVDAALIFLTALYHTIGVSVWSTTVGKRVFGLRVLRPDRTRVSLLRALARYLASAVSFLILGAGYLMVAFRADKRALHDIMCDTVVVRQ